MLTIRPALDAADAKECRARRVEAVREHIERIHPLPAHCCRLRPPTSKVKPPAMLISESSGRMQRAASDRLSWQPGDRKDSDARRVRAGMAVAGICDVGMVDAATFSAPRQTTLSPRVPSAQPARR